MVEPPHPPLVADTVRHVGDQVAVVIAETQAQARDAAELIEVDYEELKPDRRPGRCAASRRPAGLGRCQGQSLLRLAYRRQGGRRRRLRQGGPCHQDRPGQPAPDPQRHGAARRDRRLRPRDRRIHALHHQPEPARHPAPDGRLRAADAGAQAARGRARRRRRLRLEDLPLRRGGARHLGRRQDRPAGQVDRRAQRILHDRRAWPRPCRATPSWRWTRTASSSACASAPSPTWAPISRPSRPACRPISTARCSRASTRPRRSMPRCKAVFTNTVAVDAYRGAGRPEATYLLERLVDKAAREMGIDRVEIRRKNFIPTDAFPYQTPVALQYDSGDYHCDARHGAEDRRLGRLREAQGRGEEPRQAARHRHLDLHRGLRHRALGGGGRARRPRRPLRDRRASASTRPAR